MEPLWHYKRGDQRFGPVPVAELKRLARTGMLLAADMIRQNGTFDWLPASSKPEMFEPPPPSEPADLTPVAEPLALVWMRTQ